MKINNITGSPVEGENFFGREKDIDFVWTRIEKGNSLILSAPRRVGKSSFAKKQIEKAKAAGWNTLEINLEEVSSEAGFVKLFIEKLEAENWWQNFASKTGKAFDELIKSIKPTIEYEGLKMDIEWKGFNKDVYEKLKKLLHHDANTLIMIDELTILLNALLHKENGMENVTYFLHWLRSLRQTSGSKIRWIFCSSIGIDNFTNLHNLSYSLNDVSRYPIDEYQHEEAIRLISALAENEGIDFSPEEMNYFLQKLGWNLPFFIQILFANINQNIKVQGEELSINLIDDAYQQLINANHLNTWNERLIEYADIEMHARSLLKALSKNPEGESREALFHLIYLRTNDEDKTDMIIAKLLKMLSNDGYIIQRNNEKYVFRSPLLRDFWFNRFVK